MRRLSLPATTERLVIRDFRASDRSFEVAVSEQPSLFVRLPIQPRSESEIDRYVAARLGFESFDAIGDTCALIVESAETGEYVGSIQLTPSVVEPLQLQIGWLALPRHHGKGLMAEAVERVLALAFDSTGAHRIVAEIIGGNDASVRLVERIGFRKEAHFVRSTFLEGEWRDEMVYAILATERSSDPGLATSNDSFGFVRQSDDLRELVAGYFHSFTAGDPFWVERHVRDDGVLRLIGTSPDEWLQGVDAFARFRREAASATGTLRADVSDVEAFSSGDVGWGAGRVRFTTGSGMAARARFSAVFTRDDGTWKVVSSHTSIPVPDQDAFSAE